MQSNLKKTYEDTPNLTTLAHKQTEDKAHNKLKQPRLD